MTEEQYHEEIEAYKKRLEESGLVPPYIDGEPRFTDCRNMTEAELKIMFPPSGTGYTQKGERPITDTSYDDQLHNIKR